MADGQMRQLRGIDDVLAPLAGDTPTYFEPMWGNNGDQLIEHGSRKALARSGIPPVASAEDARAIVLNGGGAMSPMWGGIDALVRYIELAPAEIVVLPSSFWPTDALQVVRDAIERSDVRLTLFARERESHQRLLEAMEGSAKVLLAHDMALQLDSGDLERLRTKKRHRKPYALVVERRDAEASTSISASKAVRMPFKQFVPMQLKRLVKRAIHRRAAMGTEFAQMCLQHAHAYDIGPDEVMYADVSQVGEFSFAEFLSAVIDAEVVFTTRLHVAIARHIVGKPCFLQPTGGKYRKNEAVFEHSLREAGHVRLLDA